MKDPAEAVLACIEGADRTSLQNILMRMPDKVCAVALATLPRERRDTVYALVARPKAERIEEEIRLESRRRTSEMMRARIIRTFLSYFGRARSLPGRIYIRPRRARR